MRAAIYARVSSAAQRERDTIASQLRVLPEFVARKGWTLVETYVDDGATARTGHLARRPALARLLADAAAKRYDVVVVVDLDRLTRSDDHAERGAILGAFQRSGIQIAIAPSDQLLDLSTTSGDLLGSLYAFFAAEENRKRGSRIAAGKVTAIHRGHKPSGPTPYGLAYDRASHTWAVDPVTAPIVREVLERVAAGDSCLQIASDFEARQVPRSRSGHWSKERVWAIARNTHYLGTWVADRARRLEIAVPPVVEAELVERAQRSLLGHHRRGLHRDHSAVYLLQGLAVCGRCGSPVLVRSRAPQRRGLYTPSAYLCRARKLASVRPSARCDAPLVPTAEMDARLWRAVSAQLATPALLDRLTELDERRRGERVARPVDAQAAAERTLGRLARVEVAILARYRRGEIEEAALDAELAALRQERAAATAARDHAARARHTVDLDGRRARSRADLVRELGRAVEVATPQERQRILQLVVAPHSAVLQTWGDLEICLRVDLAAGGSARSALDSDYSVQRGNLIEIQVVA